jgi:hypothetical protein
MNIISPCNVLVTWKAGNEERQETRMGRNYDVLIVNTLIAEECNVIWRF